MANSLSLHTLQLIFQLTISGRIFSPVSIQVWISVWMESFLCFYLILLETDKIISLKKLFNSKSFAFMHSLGLKFIKFRDLTSTLGVIPYEILVSLVFLQRERPLAGIEPPCSAGGPKHSESADALLWCADTTLYCPGPWEPQSFSAASCPSPAFGLHSFHFVCIPVLFPVQLCLSSPPAFRLQGSWAQKVLLLLGLLRI